MVHLILIFDEHMPTCLWYFCTNVHNSYFFSQVFVSRTIFFVGLLHTILCFVFFIRKSHTNGICTYLPFSMFFFVDFYLHTYDHCHGGMFALPGLPHSSICTSSNWLSVRNSSALFPSVYRLISITICSTIFFDINGQLMFNTFDIYNNFNTFDISIL